MPRRPRKNWPLRIALGLALLLLSSYIAWPLVGPPQEAAEWLEGENRAEQIRQRAVGALTGLWFFVFGATIGSFLNVVVHRLPLGITLVSEPSRCPYCRRPILFRHNIPILGWLMLRGRCRVCRLPISPRYPLVELLVACIFFSLFSLELASGGASLPVRTPGRPGVMWNVLSPRGDLIAIYLYHCFMMSVLVVCGLLRVDRQTVPRRLLALAILVGLGVPFPWPTVSVVPWTATRPAWLGYGPPWSHIEAPVVGLMTGLVVGLLIGGLRRLGARSGYRPPREGSLAREYLVVFPLIGLFLGWQAVVPTLLITATFYVTTRAIMRFVDDPAGYAHLWSMHAVLGTWLLLALWRVVSSIRWAPGAESPPIVHVAWLMITLVVLVGTFRDVPEGSTTDALRDVSSLEPPALHSEQCAGEDTAEHQQRPA